MRLDLNNIRKEVCNIAICMCSVLVLLKFSIVTNVHMYECVVFSSYVYVYIRIKAGLM